MENDYKLHFNDETDRLELKNILHQEISED